MKIDEKWQISVNAKEMVGTTSPTWDSKLGESQHHSQTSNVGVRVGDHIVKPLIQKTQSHLQCIGIGYLISLLVYTNKKKNNSLFTCLWDEDGDGEHNDQCATGTEIDKGQCREKHQPRRQHGKQRNHPHYHSGSYSKVLETNRQTNKTLIHQYTYVSNSF